MEGLRHNYITLKGENKNKKGQGKKVVRRDFQKRCRLFTIFKWTLGCEKAKRNKIGKDEQILYSPKKSNQSIFDSKAIALQVLEEE